MSRQISQRREKIKWNDTMLNDLLALKKEALSITNGDNPPRKSNGRKIGYMELLLKLWNEKGYEYLGLTSQNIADVANQTERKQKKLLTRISDTINIDRINSNTHDVINEVEIVDDNPELRNNIFNILELDINKLNKLFEHSEHVYESISCIVGDYSKREWKTKFRNALMDSEINYIGLYV